MASQLAYRLRVLASRMKTKNLTTQLSNCSGTMSRDMTHVREKGLEPSLHCWNQILSLARLPIPPLAQTYTAIAEITLVLYNKRQ